MAVALSESFLGGPHLHWIYDSGAAQLCSPPDASKKRSDKGFNSSRDCVLKYRDVFFVLYLESSLLYSLTVSLIKGKPCSFAKLNK